MKIALNDVSARHPSSKADAILALRGWNLSVEGGEQVAVIGPSGAGKTTLLHLMACALAPAQGSLRLGELDPWGLGRRALQLMRGELFLAPQVPPLPPRQRVVTSVLAGRLPHESLWASLRSLAYPANIALADSALDAFGLSEKLFDRVDRLSGGERQRVGLARALTSQAKLLLVDEPLSALDPANAQQAIEALTQAARQRGATLITSLHHVDMALAHFPRIVGLRSGELVFDLPASSVTPRHLKDLYAEQLHELDGPATSQTDLAQQGAKGIAVNCR